MPQTSPAVIDRFHERYAFLSNFYACPVLLGGDVYPTAEHAYQAAKTEDIMLRDAIWAAKTPGRAKRIGREVPLRPNWDEIKLEVMRQILRAKFRTPELRKRLLATGDAVLIEGNDWRDRYWGMYQGQGENWLGKLLMEVRDELRQGG